MKKKKLPLLENLKALTLSFGQLKGLVSEAAVKDFAKKAGGDVNKILAPQLRKGAILLVSIMDDKLVDGFAPCQIETEPVLQGALFAIQNGNVIASQGGFHNTGFDRSFKAVRQLGSSWKPILYALALKYHWNYPSATARRSASPVPPSSWPNARRPSTRLGQATS